MACKTDRSFEAKTFVTLLLQVDTEHWISVRGERRISDSLLQWHSSLITERIDTKVIKTIKNSYYILEGEPSLTPMIEDGHSEFKKGFPENWKEALILGDKKDNDKEVGVDVNLYEEKNEKTVDNNNNNNNVVEIECNKSSESEAKTKSGRSVRPPGTWWKIKHTVKEKVTKLSRPRKQKSADSNSDLSGYDQTNKSKRNVYSFSNAKRQKLSNVF
ncbi:7627_t:CDS:2, partial [Entrophospora sp. SA101]